MYRVRDIMYQYFQFLTHKVLKVLNFDFQGFYYLFLVYFRNNPSVQAMHSRQQEVKQLTEENQALKTRVKLLEEGQTKDLTILVGQKVEEGASSEEVKGKDETTVSSFGLVLRRTVPCFSELREQLRSAEVKKSRIIDAFKKTSHDFREVCFQLTGYRVDGLSNHQYRLTSMYAESPERDQLLFQRNPADGECMLLETAYSNQLGELIDLVGGSLVGHHIRAFVRWLRATFK